MAAAGGTVLVTLLGVLYLQVVMLQRQRQLDGLARDRTEVTREYQNLRRKVAQLESPEAVVRRATDELGMVSAPGVLYLEPAAANGPSTSLVRDLGDGAPNPAPATTAAADVEAGAQVAETPGAPNAAAAPPTGEAAPPETAAPEGTAPEDSGTPSTDAESPPTDPSDTRPTGTPTTDPANGLPIDPRTGKTEYDPATGLAIDPTTGQPVSLDAVRDERCGDMTDRHPPKVGMGAGRAMQAAQPVVTLRRSDRGAHPANEPPPRAFEPPIRRPRRGSCSAQGPTDVSWPVVPGTAARARPATPSAPVTAPWWAWLACCRCWSP